MRVVKSSLSRPPRYGGRSAFQVDTNLKRSVKRSGASGEIAVATGAAKSKRGFYCRDDDSLGGSLGVG